MKTNVSSTSIHTYYNDIAGKKENSQDALILAAIDKLGPCTARMIQKEVNLEINCISRSLNNLWSGNKGRPVMIFLNKVDVCPVTGKQVRFYVGKNYEKNLQ